MSDTSTTNITENRRQALVWIAQQLRWERTLAELRETRSQSSTRAREAA